MDSKLINKVRDWFYDNTRLLTDDLLSSFRQEPSIITQYSDNELRPMAEQGVTAFRDILIGAMEFDTPQIVRKEMAWLETLLKARQVEGNRSQVFYDIITNRLKLAFNPSELASLLKFLEEAKSA